MVSMVPWTGKNGISSAIQRNTWSQTHLMKVNNPLTFTYDLELSSLHQMIRIFNLCSMQPSDENSERNIRAI